MVKKAKVVFLILMLMACSPLFIQPAGGASEKNQQPPPVSVESNFVIGAEDVLEIVVWKEPELSKTIPVRPDGKILLPMINEVQAAGKTPAELQADLTQLFSKYFEEVSVAVIVKEINSHKFFILGKVRNPGAYKTGSDVTIIQAISLAGGFVEFADTNNIKIFHKGTDQNKPIRIKYKKIISGKDPAQNIIIQPGDTIVVP